MHSLCIRLISMSSLSSISGYSSRWVTNQFSNSIRAVSYTHLDVYKRQSSTSSSWLWLVLLPVLLKTLNEVFPSSPEMLKRWLSIFSSLSLIHLSNLRYYSSVLARFISVFTPWNTCFAWLTCSGEDLTASICWSTVSRSFWMTPGFTVDTASSRLLASTCLLYTSQTLIYIQNHVYH